MSSGNSGRGMSYWIPVDEPDANPPSLNGAPSQNEGNLTYRILPESQYKIPESQSCRSLSLSKHKRGLSLSSSTVLPASPGQQPDSQSSVPPIKPVPTLQFVPDPQQNSNTDDLIINIRSENNTSEMNGSSSNNVTADAHDIGTGTTSANSLEVSCGVCDNGMQASAWCADCPYFLCIRCCKYHTKLKVTRNHRMVFLSDNNTTTDNAEPVSNNESGNISHSQTQTLQKVVETNRQVIYDKIKQAEMKMNSINDSLKKIQKQEGDSKAMYESVMNELLTVKDRTAGDVQQNHGQLIQDARTAYTQTSTELTDQTSKLTDLHDTINAVCQHAKWWASQGNDADMAAKATTIINKLASFDSIDLSDIVTNTACKITNLANKRNITPTSVQYEIENVLVDIHELTKSEEEIIQEEDKINDAEQETILPHTTNRLDDRCPSLIRNEWKMEDNQLNVNDTESTLEKKEKKKVTFDTNCDLLDELIVDITSEQTSAVITQAPSAFDDTNLLNDYDTPQMNGFPNHTSSSIANPDTNVDTTLLLSCDESNANDFQNQTISHGNLLTNFNMNSLGGCNAMNMNSSPNPVTSNEYDVSKIITIGDSVNENVNLTDKSTNLVETNLTDVKTMDPLSKLNNSESIQNKIDRSNFDLFNDTTENNNNTDISADEIVYEPKNEYTLGESYVMDLQTLDPFEPMVQTSSVENVSELIEEDTELFHLENRLKKLREDWTEETVNSENNIIKEAKISPVTVLPLGEDKYNVKIEVQNEIPSYSIKKEYCEQSAPVLLVERVPRQLEKLLPVNIPDYIPKKKTKIEKSDVEESCDNSHTSDVLDYHENQDVGTNSSEKKDKSDQENEKAMQTQYEPMCKSESVTESETSIEISDDVSIDEGEKNNLKSEEEDPLIERETMDVLKSLEDENNPKQRCDHDEESVLNKHEHLYQESELVSEHEEGDENDHVIFSEQDRDMNEFDDAQSQTESQTNGDGWERSVDNEAQEIICALDDNEPHQLAEELEQDIDRDVEEKQAEVLLCELLPDDTQQILQTEETNNTEFSQLKQVTSETENIIQTHQITETILQNEVATDKSDQILTLTEHIDRSENVSEIGQIESVTLKSQQIIEDELNDDKSDQRNEEATIESDQTSTLTEHIDRSEIVSEIGQTQSEHSNESVTSESEQIVENELIDNKCDQIPTNTSTTQESEESTASEQVTSETEHIMEESEKEDRATENLLESVDQPSARTMLPTDDDSMNEDVTESGEIAESEQTKSESEEINEAGIIRKSEQTEITETESEEQTTEDEQLMEQTIQTKLQTESETDKVSEEYEVIAETERGTESESEQITETELMNKSEAETVSEESQNMIESENVSKSDQIVQQEQTIESSETELKSDESSLESDNNTSTESDKINESEKADYEQNIEQETTDTKPYDTFFNDDQSSVVDEHEREIESSEQVDQIDETENVTETEVTESANTNDSATENPQVTADFVKSQSETVTENEAESTNTNEYDKANQQVTADVDKNQSEIVTENDEAVKSSESQRVEDDEKAKQDETSNEDQEETDEQIITSTMITGEEAEADLESNHETAEGHQVQNEISEKHRADEGGGGQTVNVNDVEVRSVCSSSYEATTSPAPQQPGASDGADVIAERVVMEQLKSLSDGIPESSADSSPSASHYHNEVSNKQVFKPPPPYEDILNHHLVSHKATLLREYGSHRVNETHKGCEMFRTRPAWPESTKVYSTDRELVRKNAYSSYTPPPRTVYSQHSTISTLSSSSEQDSVSTISNESLHKDSIKVKQELSYVTSTRDLNNTNVTNQQILIPRPPPQSSKKTRRSRPGPASHRYIHLGQTQVSGPPARVVVDHADTDLGDLVHQFYAADKAGAIAVNKAGVVAVIDLASESVKFYNQQYVFIRAEYLRQPTDVVAMTNGNFVVTANNELHQFSSSGKPVKTIPLDRQIMKAQNLAVAKNGHFVICDPISKDVHFVSAGGYRQGSLTNHVAQPSCVAVDQYGFIIITDQADSSVKIFDQHGKTLLWDYGSSQQGGGELNYPQAVQADRWGNILVADSGNDRVLILTPDAHFKGFLTNTVIQPTGIATTPAGQALITEYDTGVVYVYRYNP